MIRKKIIWRRPVDAREKDKMSSDIFFNLRGKIIWTLLLMFGAVFSSACNLTSAQNEQSNTQQAKEFVQKDFEFVRSIEEPCRYLNADYLKKSSDNVLYELMNAGFPKEVSLEEAVAVFNKFVECDQTGKSQPPLTAAEVTAAIRDWNCENEKQISDKKTCAEFWKIAETGRMPKGTLIDYDGAAKSYHERGYKGYDVKTWEIYIYIHLDKYRRDLKDVPQFSHLIRLNYISSEPAKKS